MDEVTHNLWIGDLSSALDANGLEEKNIHSIVSAMRGRVTLHDVSQIPQRCKVSSFDDLVSGFQQASDKHR
jgi:hypothetical protein